MDKDNPGRREGLRYDKIPDINKRIEFIASDIARREWDLVLDGRVIGKYFQGTGGWLRLVVENGQKRSRDNVG